MASANGYARQYEALAMQNQGLLDSHGALPSPLRKSPGLSSVNDLADQIILQARAASTLANEALSISPLTAEAAATVD